MNSTKLTHLFYVIFVHFENIFNSDFLFSKTFNMFVNALVLKNFFKCLHIIFGNSIHRFIIIIVWYFSSFSISMLLLHVPQHILFLSIPDIWFGLVWCLRLNSQHLCSCRKLETIPNSGLPWLWNLVLNTADIRLVTLESILGIVLFLWQFLCWFFSFTFIAMANCICRV